MTRVFFRSKKIFYKRLQLCSQKFTHRRACPFFLPREQDYDFSEARGIHKNTHRKIGRVRERDDLSALCSSVYIYIASYNCRPDATLLTVMHLTIVSLAPRFWSANDTLERRKIREPAAWDTMDLTPDYPARLRPSISRVRCLQRRLKIYCQRPRS